MDESSLVGVIKIDSEQRLCVTMELIGSVDGFLTRVKRDTLRGLIVR